MRPAGGHEVDGLDRAQRHHGFVAAAVAGDADALHRQEDGKGLAGALVPAGAAQFLDEDVVGQAQGVGGGLGDLAEDAHAQARPREGVALHHLGGQAKFEADGAHFVLEQLAQRLDQFELHVLGQAADVVVALDDVRLAGLAAGGFDHVRVDGALGEEVDAFDPGGFFVEVFDDESKKLKNAKWLAQGTIYPDVIESAASKTGKAHAIKSHHNVGGLPETLNLKLLEPLRELFKDEVRELGIALGLPHEMVYRHPFPGPGLGVRILGEVKKEFADLLRRADAIFIDELRAADWYDKTSQAFAVFLPVKSVGVMGDGRTYEYVVALRAVQTADFMTAQWAELPHSLLARVSNRIINEVRGINRVVYDISGKPPATIEWE